MSALKAKRTESPPIASNWFDNQSVDCCRHFFTQPFPLVDIGTCMLAYYATSIINRKTLDTPCHAGTNISNWQIECGDILSLSKNENIISRIMDQKVLLGMLLFIRACDGPLCFAVI